MLFSANLGFLWTDLSLPDAIHAAADAGFDAVECHWPYDTPPDQVAKALQATGLAMLGLNTRRGSAGENGLAALPGRKADARAAIAEAVDYAVQIGAGAVHVMAGFAQGAQADAAFRANLIWACERAQSHRLTVLIEPLNPYDAPGYFLNDADQAARIIHDIAQPNLKMMFDCYHLQICGGDICRRFARLMPLIGHVQIAAVPDRGAPDHGELDYGHVLRAIGALGWAQPIGAEYRPAGKTETSLEWLVPYQAIAVEPT